MKRLTLTLAVLVTVIGTAFATGNDKKDSRVTVLPGQDRYKLIYTGDEATTVKIRVRDENGKLLRTDRIKNETGFMKPYNTKKLNAGTYTFEVTDKYGVVEQEFTIAPVKETKVMEVRAMDDQKYRLIVKQEEIGPLFVTIYDSKNNILHQEKHQDMDGFTRIYDLSRFNSENFIFELLDKTSKKVVSVQ